MLGSGIMASTSETTIHQLPSIPNSTPFVDLAEICKDRKQVHGMDEVTYGITCFMCEHYWTWHNQDWSCELKGKERIRKMKEAILYKGQTKL